MTLEDLALAEAMRERMCVIAGIPYNPPQVPYAPSYPMTDNSFYPCPMNLSHELESQADHTDDIDRLN